MIDAGLTSLASQYFSGLQISQSLELCTSDPHVFVYEVVGTTLTPIEDSDGSTQYFDDAGALAAFVDGEGNVFVDRGDEVVIYASESYVPKDQPIENIFEDKSGMVCSLEKDFYEAIEGAQSVMPAPSQMAQTENAAKNLFGEAVEFVTDFAREVSAKKDGTLAERIGAIIGEKFEEGAKLVGEIIETAQQAADDMIKKQSEAKIAQAENASAQLKSEPVAENLKAPISNDLGDDAKKIEFTNEDKPANKIEFVDEPKSTAKSDSTNQVLLASAEGSKAAKLGPYTNETASPENAIDSTLTKDAIASSQTSGASSEQPDARISEKRANVSEEGLSRSSELSSLAGAMVMRGEELVPASATELPFTEFLTPSIASGFDASDAHSYLGEFEALSYIEEDDLKGEGSEVEAASSESVGLPNLSSHSISLGVPFTFAIVEENPSLIAECVKHMGGLPPTMLSVSFLTASGMPHHSDLRLISALAQRGDPSHHGGDKDGQGKGRDRDESSDTEDQEAMSVSIV